MKQLLVIYFFQEKVNFPLYLGDYVNAPPIRISKCDAKLPIAKDSCISLSREFEKLLFLLEYYHGKPAKNKMIFK